MLVIRSFFASFLLLALITIHQSSALPTLNSTSTLSPNVSTNNETQFVKRHFFSNFTKSDEEKLREARENIARGDKLTVTDFRRLARSTLKEDHQMIEERLNHLNTNDALKFAKDLVTESEKQSSIRADKMDAIKSTKYEVAHWDKDHMAMGEVVENSKTPYATEYNHNKNQEAQRKIEKIHKLAKKLNEHIEINLSPKAKSSSDKKTLKKAQLHIERTEDIQNLRSFFQKEKAHKEQMEEIARTEIAASRKGTKEKSKVNPSSTTSTRVSKGESLSESESRQSSLLEDGSTIKGKSDDESSSSSSSKDGSRSSSLSHNNNQEKAEVDTKKLDSKVDTTDSSSDLDERKRHSSSRKTVTFAEQLEKSQNDDSGRYVKSPGPSDYDSTESYESLDPLKSPDSVLPGYSSVYDAEGEDWEKKKKSSSRGSWFFGRKAKASSSPSPIHHRSNILVRG